MEIRRSGLAAGLTAVLVVACGDGPTGPSAADFEDQPAPDPQPEVVAFVNVNVVPMDGEYVIYDQTVIVRGDRIDRIGPAEFTDIPAGAFRIEGYDRYLVPGLADMHVHMTQDTFEEMRNDFVLYLANGVTTVRVMWGGSGVLAERDRVESGETLGPTQLVASPGIDGPGGTWTASTPPVSTPEEARQRTATHAAAGYDFIKVYNDLDVESYDAIVEEAEAQGVSVVGHVPSRVGIEHVQDAGQLTLEHMIGLRYRAASTFSGGTLDMGVIADLAGRSAANGVWHTPTVLVDALSISTVANTRASDELRLVSPGMRDFFETGFYHGLDDDVANRERDNHRAMIRALHDAGTGLLVGTDAGFGWILPGYAIHDELAHFVAADLTPFQALRAATSEAARAVGATGEFGTIQEGARADLLLLTQNPLEGLSALEEKSGTMVRGRWLSRGTLDRMLAEVRASYAPGASLAATKLPDPGTPRGH